MTTDRTGDVEQPLWKRLLWFAALWVAGVISIMVVSYALRSLII
ncbi:hypothetical protein PsAD2_04373 [Pseudovibrio axinellae]|uniref:DUF2474 domain-containing protein n=1 Tax=Pseudovibrio axinellae TaxID=989403 RepID=A0A165T574_9HYPH|nr:DUF2474 family protein [Pseudovibrio axinellae]KZL05448.1 hypothetical protein PsAD2_04373 [Pseudovibrio axinellae]SEP98774.1 Protein of unknown function [Pseudovibrio axinellae]